MAWRKLYLQEQRMNLWKLLANMIGRLRKPSGKAIAEASAKHLHLTPHTRPMVTFRARVRQARKDTIIGQNICT
jgi:hypothetical protein